MRECHNDARSCTIATSNAWQEVHFQCPKCVGRTGKLAEGHLDSFRGGVSSVTLAVSTWYTSSNVHLHGEVYFTAALMQLDESTPALVADVSRVW